MLEILVAGLETTNINLRVVRAEVRSATINHNYMYPCNIIAWHIHWIKDKLEGKPPQKNCCRWLKSTLKACVECSDLVSANYGMFH